MRKLGLVIVLAVAATVACERATPPAGEESPPAAAAGEGASPAGQKKTWIYFTKNHNQGTGPGQYNTPCIGIVATETIGARRGYKLMWQVHPGNGQGDDDKCDGLVNTDVSLVFVTDVMGQEVMKRLTANPGGLIQGTVSEDDTDLGSLTVHKYHVELGMVPAGPDPIIIVDCSGCGPVVP